MVRPMYEASNWETAVRNTEKTSKKVSIKSPTKAQLNTITSLLPPPTDTVGTRKLCEILQLDETQSPRRDVTETSAVEPEINTPSLN